MILKYIISVF